MRVVVSVKFIKLYIQEFVPQVPVIEFGVRGPPLRIHDQFSQQCCVKDESLIF